MSTLAPDQLILDGRFRIVRPLASGGMGDVYVAEQVSLGRQVAVKHLRDELRAHPGMEERFRREAQLLSTVDHPSVVRVIDFGQNADAAFLVMEMIEGETLEARLRTGTLTRPQCLAALRQFAEGLSAIHACGIVHRDLKPENVILSEGPEGIRARLLDFGIARLAEPDPEVSPGITQVGLVLGTPEYVSPEQAMGKSLDARSDVYAFGVVAFRVLAGQLPFAGPSAREFLAQHLTVTPISLRELAAWTAEELPMVELVMRCLEKDPLNRPASGADLVRALAGGAAPVPPAPEPAGAPAQGAPQGTGTALFGAAANEPGRETLKLKQWNLSAHGRTFLWAAVAVALVASAWMASRSTLASRVERMLAGGEAPEAWKLLSELPKEEREVPSVRRLEARVLHALKRHAEEWSALQEVPARDFDREIQINLAEDYGRAGSTGARTLLEKVSAEDPGALAKLAERDFDLTQWGALRHLDRAGKAEGLDLGGLYARALESDSCPIRKTAVARLGELKAVSAIGALEKLAASPKRKPSGLFDDGDCGHAQAEATLKRLRPLVGR